MSSASIGQRVQFRDALAVSARRQASVVPTVKRAGALSGSVVAAVACMGLIGATRPAPPPSTQAAAQSILAPIPPLELRSGGRGGIYIASDYPNPGPLPFRPENVQQRKSGEVVLTLNSAGSAELQRRRPAASAGTVEVDVTLPRMKTGVIVAPLFLYGRWEPRRGSDEIDFEVVGLKGLQVALHRRGRGEVYSRILIPGDLSGQRMRLGLIYNLPEFISFTVNGKVMHTVRGDQLPPGAMPVESLNSLHSIWPTQAVGWAGPWRPLVAGESLQMTIHAFGMHPVD